MELSAHTSLIRITALALLVTVFSACEREELPVAPHTAGTAFTSTISMDANYRWQVYFDLGTNREVGRCLKTSWDLAFETLPSSFHILLNGSKAMSAWNTGDTVFTQLTDTTGFTAGKQFDAASGNTDSTAIGNWQTNMPVYIIDRGYNENGQHQGFRKLQILSVSAGTYQLRFATLNGAVQVLTVNKDSTYNFTFVSLQNTGEIISVEPPKATWDLVFTQYTHIFHQPPTPYLVTGCLQNTWQTGSVMDTVSAFENIDYNFAASRTLSGHRDVIGYNWKVFNGTEFTIVPQRNYIIRDSEGFFYKLRFTDFYDDNGVKGNPKWEFQRL
jgi:hypothetical protein